MLVYHRRLNAAVAHKATRGHDILSALDQLACKIMPATMRRGGCVQAALLAKNLEDLLDQADADASMLPDNQERSLGRRGEAAHRQERHQCRDGLAGRLVQRDCA